MTRTRKLRWALGGLLLFALLAAVGFWARPVAVFRAFTRAEMRFRGAQSRWVTVQGYRIHYYVTPPENVTGPGNGPVVVLIHGLGGRSDDWVNLAPYLSRAGYRVYMPDLPGFGQSEQPPDFSYSVRDQAAVVVAFLDAMGLRQVDLGGWSMGGWIVQRVAAEHPERVSKLLLFDSAGLYEKPQWDIGLFTPRDAGQIDQLNALLRPAPPWVPGFIARDILRQSNRNAWVIHRTVHSMLTGRDTTDKLLPELEMPVQILWGAEDRIVPLSQAEKMQKLIPHAQLDVIPGCGHLAPNQCAGQMAPKVIAFLNR